MTVSTKKYKILRVSDKIFMYVILIFVTIITIFPFYWMIATSIKPFDEIYTDNPSIIPKNITFENYDFVISYGYLNQLKNSVIISLTTAALNTIISLFGAYAVARIKFLGKNVLTRSILATYAMPYTLLVIPFFVIMLSLKLTNNLFSVILAMTTFTLPFTVLTLASYLQSIPIEVEEQALIDGCGRVDILFRIILPLAAPAIVAISMYSFVFSWNEYLYVIVLVSSEDLFTLPVGIASLLTSDIIPWGKMLAMSVLYAIPGMAFFAFLQKYLIAGLTKGALKY